MMQVTCWGTRGSFPVSGERFVRHGGATTCLEVRAGEERVVIDCGTGLVRFGQRGTLGSAPITIYQTHMHWDHVQGFPFFAPLFDPSCSITLCAVNREQQTMRDVLAAQMSRPTFPVGLDALNASLSFEELEPRGERAQGALRISWQEMAHPGGSTAYRFDFQDHAVVFSGDVEIQEAGCRNELIEFAQGSDLVLIDAQYFPEEYAARRGFGHSTPLDAVEVALAAGAKSLLLTHHDPTHDDEALGRKLELARRHAGSRPLSVDNAYDGLIVEVGRGSLCRAVAPEHALVSRCGS